MCTVAMAAVTAAMTVASAVAQDQQQRSAAKAQTNTFEQNKASALQSMRDTMQQTQLRQQQEELSANEAIQDRERLARQELASARVGAGEAGISGYSVDSVLRDISGAAETDILRTGTNRDWTIDQLNAQQVGNRATAANQANSMSPGTAPSTWASMFNIGTSAVKGYGQYTSATGNDPVGSWAKSKINQYSGSQTAGTQTVTGG